MSLGAAGTYTAEQQLEYPRIGDKHRRDKPFNDIRKLIQEAHQPNRKAKATAARMLARMVESNKTICEVRQTYAKDRARVRRERKTQLGRVGTTEAIAAIKKWKM